MDDSKHAESGDATSPDPTPERAGWEAPRLSRLAVATTEANTENGGDAGLPGSSES